MAVPKSRVSRSKRNMRRAHDSIKTTAYHECENCGELKRPHHVCASCGHYDSRDVLDMDDTIDLDEDAA